MNLGNVGRMCYSGSFWRSWVFGLFLGLSILFWKIFMIIMGRLDMRLFFCVMFILWMVFCIVRI